MTLSIEDQRKITYYEFSKKLDERKNYLAKNYPFHASKQGYCLELTIEYLKGLEIELREFCIDNKGVFYYRSVWGYRLKTRISKQALYDMIKNY